MVETPRVERRQRNRRTSVLQRIMLEGLVAGVIGALSVALWFLLVDLVDGTPFFTPAMLGGAVFHGLRDPASVEITVQAVAGYTFLHVLAFVAAGMVAAALTTLADRFPTTLFLVVVFFAVFEVGFYVLVAVLATPLLGSLAWSNVAIGNLIAAGGMGYYLWRSHPHLREELAAHPLGETIDDHTDEHPVHNKA